MPMIKPTYKCDKCGKDPVVAFTTEGRLCEACLEKFKNDPTRKK